MYACARLLSACATIVGIAVPGHAARAAALSWNNAVGGAAATASNWTPAQVPTAADDLTFNLVATYGVTFNATVNASNTHTYKRGTVTLTMSATHTASSGLTVADAGTDTSEVTLTTGTFNSNALTTIADVSGSVGILNVNDDDADLIVGNNGNATLEITGAGRVQTPDQLIVGSNSTSTSFVTVSGFSVAPVGRSLLQVLGTGESRIGQGGDVTMTVDTGALAQFDGDVIIANGAASTSSVTVQTAGLLSAQLDVGGDVLIGRNSSATAAGNGTLNVNTGGAAVVDGATFLGDPNGGTGLLHMGGGTFTGGGSITVLAGSTINGTGTIDADISNSGAIQPTGADGLTLNGILSNTTNSVSGTRINFASGGGYTGSGSCATDIAGDNTAVITATGTLSLGRNTVLGYSYRGDLVVGANAVTLVDSNSAVLGGLTTIASGGQLSCSTGLGVQLGGRISGQGTIVGDITNAGALDPQRSPTPGGVLNVTGNLHMNPSGSYEMEIGGPPASQNHDRANFSGTATFNGTIRVTLPTGHIPHVGE